MKNPTNTIVVWLIVIIATYFFIPAVTDAIHHWEIFRISYAISILIPLLMIIPIRRRDPSVAGIGKALVYGAFIIFGYIVITNILPGFGELGIGGMLVLYNLVPAAIYFIAGGIVWAIGKGLQRKDIE